MFSKSPLQLDMQRIFGNSRELQLVKIAFADIHMYNIRLVIILSIYLSIYLIHVDRGDVDGVARVVADV